MTKKNKILSSLTPIKLVKEKLILISIIFLFILPISLSDDLSNYPDFLINNNQLNVVVAVDGSSSARNVLAQASIILSLTALGKSGSIKSKLSDEVEHINQNIISIGNPCINELSAELLDYPDPCDSDFEYGSASMIIRNYNGFYHIVVAGYSDDGTIKIADYIKQHEQAQMDGDMHTIVIDEPDPIKDITKDDEESVILISGQNSNTDDNKNIGQNEGKTTDTIEATTTSTTISNGEAETNQLSQVREKNIFQRFIDFIVSLFS